MVVLRLQGKNTSDEARERGNGDVWPWTGMDRTSKLAVAYQVGKRDADTAREFVDDLASRLAHRVQLSTDGLRLYIKPVASAFRGEVGYGQIVKLYGPSMNGASHQRRYSQAAWIGFERKVIEDAPKEHRICTSHFIANLLAEGAVDGHFDPAFAPGGEMHATLLRNVGSGSADNR